MRGSLPSLNPLFARLVDSRSTFTVAARSSGNRDGACSASARTGRPRCSRSLSTMRRRACCGSKGSPRRISNCSQPSPDKAPGENGRPVPVPVYGGHKEIADMLTHEEMLTRRTLELSDEIGALARAGIARREARPRLNLARLLLDASVGRLHGEDREALAEIARAAGIQHPDP